MQMLQIATNEEPTSDDNTITNTTKNNQNKFIAYEFTKKKR